MMKPDFIDGDYKGYTVFPTGRDYESIIIHKNDSRKIELRIVGTAIAVGRIDLDIHEWLWNTGLEIAKEMGGYKEADGARVITSYDVDGGKLITPWRNLRFDK